MIDIKDISGNILQSVPITEPCEHIEELMQSDHITLSWESDQSDILPIGAYIEYKGEKYSLLEPYSPVQNGELKFTYQPQFKSVIMSWGKIPFFMYTYSADNDITNREPDWSLTDNPANFMSVICKGIKNETGEEWTYSVDGSLPASTTLSFQSVDIFSALNSIANAFETEWWADKANKVLHLSKAEHGTAVVLEVGANINTPSVTNSKEGYYTRFYAFGSTRNIVQDYNGANVNNLINKRLTLDPVKYPNGYKDIRPGLQQGEIFPKILIFDDVYPSSNLAISDVRVRLMWTIDETTGEKVQIGTDDDGNPIYDQYAIWYFRIPSFTFNNTTYSKDNPNGMLIAGKTLSAHFETGTLQGREFELIYHDKAETVSSADGTSIVLNTGDYEIKFKEEGTYIIPAITALIPSDGDHVILFNIRMPQEYVNTAYTELEAAMDKEIARLSSDLNNYQFSSNPVAFYDNNPRLSIGRKVTYTNGDYSYTTRVIRLVTKLDYDFQQDITIGNDKIKGNTQEIKEEVASANKDLNLLTVINDMTSSLQQSYQRTQKMMMEGFAAIKDMWRFDPNTPNTIFSKYNVWTSGWLSAKGMNPGTGGSGGDSASALYQLNDVRPNSDNTGVFGASAGKVLTFGDDGKWYAASGLDANAMWTELTKSDATKKIDLSHLPTSVLTSENYATTLNNKYVTLDTAQTITEIKTFSKQLKSTVSSGTAPFVVASNTVVSNLNADMLDGYHESNFSRLVGFMTGTWDWNNVSRPGGIYKIQGGTITNHPSGVYQFGIAAVFGVTNDAENRIEQLYFPHKIDSGPWYRMRNYNTWHAWTQIVTSNNYSSILDGRYVKKSGDVMTGVLNTCAIRGVCLTGKTNASIRFNNLNPIDSESFWSFYNMKSKSGNVVAFGGLGDDIGFYGYKSDRTENNYDWKFTFNSGSGDVAISGLVRSAKGFLKEGFSNTSVLLAGGGTKLLTDFAMSNTYLPLAGGTMTGVLNLKPEQYNGNYALNLNNSNIAGVNGIIFADLANTVGEGLMFKRSNGNYDYIFAEDGVFKFAPNCVYGPSSSYSAIYKIWHEGNDGSGSGLDSDMLDGSHANVFLKSVGRTDGTFDLNTYTERTVKEIRTSEQTTNNSPFTGFGLLVNFWDSNNYCALQLASNAGNDLFFRGKHNNTSSITTSWRKLLHTLNYSDYAITLSTDQTITGKKTFEVGKFVLKGPETNNFTTTTHYPNNAWKDDDSNNYASIRNALSFKWYETTWEVGAIRGGATKSYRFGIGLRESDTKITPIFAITTKPNRTLELAPSVPADAKNKNAGILFKTRIDSEGLEQNVILRHEHYDTFVQGYGLAISKWNALEAGDSNMFFYNTGRYISKVPTGTAPYQCVSTTVNTNLNADMVDNIHEYQMFVEQRNAPSGKNIVKYADLTATTANHADFITNLRSGTYLVSRSIGNETLVRFNSNGSTSGLEFLTSYSNDAALKFRKTVDHNRVSGPWVTIITNLNIGSQTVASATKLQTARTLWGRPFDGTANVDGAIKGVTEINSLSKSTYGNFVIFHGLTTGESFRLDAYNASGTWVANAISVGTNGNVIIGGVGTTSYKLDVRGTVKSSSIENDGQYYSLKNSVYSNTVENLLNPNNSVFRAQSKGVATNTCYNILGWSDTINNVGYVTRYSIASIRGTTGWGAMVFTVGNNDGGTTGHTCSISGGGTMSWSGTFKSTVGIWSDGYLSAKGQNTSDRRLKTDIKNFNATSIIKSLRPVSFRWNELARKNNKVFDTDDVQYGLIAQEVKKVAPWAAVDNMFYDGYMGVRYEKFIPVIMKAQIETIDEVADLKRRLTNVERENERLKNEIQMLKAA